MRTYKQICDTVVWLCVSLVSIAYAHESPDSGEQKAQKFELLLSVDNTLTYSQQAVSDLSFSLTNGLGALSQAYPLYDKPALRFGARVGLGVAGFYTALFNHEMAHLLRISEFGGKADGLSFGFFGGAVEGYQPEQHPQEMALTVLSGNQANQLLSEKLVMQLLRNRTKLDPVRAFTYIFSSQNQVHYAYFQNSESGDLANHAFAMRTLYGKQSMSVSKIKEWAALELLDPILGASLVSVLTGEETAIPSIPVTESVSLIPGMKLVITPYNVLEKRLVTYIQTPQTPIKIAFGWGKESKAKDSIFPEMSEEDQQNLRAWWKGWDRYHGTLLLESLDQAPQESWTYYGECMVDRAFTLKKIEVGFSVAGWRQPELFSAKPIEAPLAMGGLFRVQARYTHQAGWGLLATLGAKSKGFVIGEPVEQTPFVRLGFTWVL